MGNEKNLEECLGRNILEWKHLIPTVLKQLKRLGWGERVKKRLDTVTREQIESVSSAEILLAVVKGLSNPAEQASYDAVTAEQELLKEISRLTPKKLRELANDLPPSGKQSLPSDHPLVNYCKCIKDCVDDVQEALTKSNIVNRDSLPKAKTVLEEQMVKLKKVHEEIELARNMAADAEDGEWWWAAGLALVAIVGLAFMAAPAVSIVAAAKLTIFGTTLGISLGTIKVIAGAVFCAAGSGAMLEASYWYSYRRTKEECDERRKEVEREQQRGNDLQKGIVGCNLTSLQKFVIEIKSKVRVLKRSVQNDHYDISQVMENLESFLKVADSYTTALIDADVGQVRS